MADVRLINADVLLCKLNRKIGKIENGHSSRRESMPVTEGMRIMELEYCIGLVQCEPVIDAVPVVRCFECANRGDKCKCPMCFDESDGIDFYQVDNTDDDGFCHYGERKEDNHATD